MKEQVVVSVDKRTSSSLIVFLVVLGPVNLKHEITNCHCHSYLGIRLKQIIYIIYKFTWWYLAKFQT